MRIEFKKAILIWDSLFDDASMQVLEHPIEPKKNS